MSILKGLAYNALMNTAVGDVFPTLKASVKATHRYLADSYFSEIKNDPSFYSEHYSSRDIDNFIENIYNDDSFNNPFYNEIINSEDQFAVKDKIGSELSQRIYGKSISDPENRSPYANQISDAILNRIGRTGIYDMSGENVHATVMPHKGDTRDWGVCADTVCAILTDADLINYLPSYMLQGQDFWSSDNDYIMEELKSNEKAGKHWDHITSSNPIEALYDMEVGDWVVAAPYPEREREELVTGNPSFKHSLIVLDKTENGILLAHGHSNISSVKYRTDTIFIPYESADKPQSSGNHHAFHKGSILNVFRFNPKEEVREVDYEEEAFSSLTYPGLSKIKNPKSVGQVISELVD